MTLGPKFRPDYRLGAIAADFHLGISRLWRHGHLEADSPFVRACLDYLQSLIETPDLEDLGLVPAFNFIETNSVSMPVIGPKYEAVESREARICDLIGDVRRLVTEGRLEATPFVAEVVSLAPGCLERSAAELAAVLQQSSSAPEDLFEHEILRALQVNLLFE